MIDLVTANEFTFTPSAFLVAYVEKSKDDLTITESTANGGTLTTFAGDGVSSSGLNTTLANKLIDEASDVASQGKVNALSVTGTVDVGTVPGGASYFIPQTVAVAPGSAVGAQGAPLSVTASAIDFLGQRVNDTRTTSKTVVVSHQFYVVLVLSYGTYKSPADDKTAAQATVAAIYAQVSNYLNSLV